MGPILRTARDAADIFGPRLAGQRLEKLLVAYLDEGRRLLRIDEAGEGRAAEIELAAADTLALAMRLGASGLVLAHNHPSGDATPSQADAAATRRLAQAAAELGLTLHDHLVFAGGECRSFRALGLI